MQKTSMVSLVEAMLVHAEMRKNEYWGRDYPIWKFYEAQSVCCRDLLLQYKKEDMR